MRGGPPEANRSHCMPTQKPNTESVVRNHLRAFIEQQGIAAILSDYHEEARFICQDRTYCGKPQIREFFESFIASLPPQANSRFELQSLRFEGDLGFITWSVSPEMPLGTDTFIVRNGKIVAQTFVCHTATAS
jgi:ketosteroid isomerase-like protein